MNEVQLTVGTRKALIESLLDLGAVNTKDSNELTGSKSIGLDAVNDLLDLRVLLMRVGGREAEGKGEIIGA